MELEFMFEMLRNELYKLQVKISAKRKNINGRSKR